ncbi:hypothetical protein LIER_38446 [Lithospermum erythrorhizon]|uniref:RNase H type-1 domain-containing protein n=1 Tax=Lithospermum erythrorhizon TaxID=34254 RepID=A0AAV3Q344_LITER
MYFDDILLYSFTLSQWCSNNVAEYQELILGLEVATELNIPQLEVYGDSQLIINQLMEEYEADALAGLASSIAYPGKEVSIPVSKRLAKAFNKTLCNLMKKTTTPYALVYGTEVVLPLEEVYSNGTHLMASSEGKQVGPINGRYLKRYYP